MIRCTCLSEREHIAASSFVDMVEFFDMLARIFSTTFSAISEGFKAGLSDDRFQLLDGKDTKNNRNKC